MKSARFFSGAFHTPPQNDKVGADEICPLFSGAFHTPPQNDEVGADGIRPFFSGAFHAPLLGRKNFP